MGSRLFECQTRIAVKHSFLSVTQLQTDVFIPRVAFFLLSVGTCCILSKEIDIWKVFETFSDRIICHPNVWHLLVSFPDKHRICSSSSEKVISRQSGSL